MFGILLSALNAALGFLVRDAVIKGIFFVAFMYILTEVISYLLMMLPTAASLQPMLDALAGYPLLIWLLGVIRFDYGITVIMSAVVTRFLIRRLPVIG